MCPKETLNCLPCRCIVPLDLDYPEHLARDHRTAGEEKTQQEWKAEHPLAHRLMGKNIIYQKGCALGHAPCPTARAESTPFATKSD